MTDKVNLIVKEATAKKAETQPSKIEASKEKVAERKATDAALKPCLADMVNSMKKQTESMLVKNGSQFNKSKINKPKSFPPIG